MFQRIVEVSIMVVAIFCVIASAFTIAECSHVKTGAAGGTPMFGR